MALPWIGTALALFVLGLAFGVMIAFGVVYLKLTNIALLLMSIALAYSVLGIAFGAMYYLDNAMEQSDH
jgi:uncharacterized membrane protein YidH (DUF202 family)